jgi:hypothetical protein
MNQLETRLQIFSFLALISDYGLIATRLDIDMAVFLGNPRLPH